MGSCDIKDYIKAADWILTSPDSTSMVAEVVMSGSKLLVLYDEQSMQDEQIKHQLKFLAQQHWLYLLTVSDSYQISQVVQELEMQDHTSEITRKLNRVLDK
nr:ELM1/GtrOC1 family putative glycosyltransferase [Acinetobacter baumannii]